jgi:hypothetical protein
MGSACFHIASCTEANDKALHLTNGGHLVMSEN